MSEEKEEQNQEPEVSMAHEGNSQSEEVDMMKISVNDVLEMVDHLAEFKVENDLKELCLEDVIEMAKHLRAIEKIMEQY